MLIEGKGYRDCVMVAMVDTLGLNSPGYEFHCLLFCQAVLISRMMNFLTTDSFNLCCV